MTDQRLAIVSPARDMLRRAGLIALDSDIELLDDDIRAVRDEDMPDAMLETAARELERRSGGLGNLESYLRCLRVAR